MFHVGGMMYLLGSHYSAIKHLLSNPEFYTEKSLDTFSKELKEFTVNQRHAGYADKCVLQPNNDSSNTSSRGKKMNPAALLESDKEEETQAHPCSTTTATTSTTEGRKTKKGKASKKTK